MRAAIVVCLMLAGCAGAEPGRTPPPDTEERRADDERLDRACLQAVFSTQRGYELNSVKLVRLPDEPRPGFRPARRGIEVRSKAGANEAVIGYPCQETEKGEAMITGIGLGGL
jgi:hypothetical protein